MTYRATATTALVFFALAGRQLGAAPLVLQDGRLEFRARWVGQHAATAGLGIPVALTRDSGYFWFYGPENVELVVKTVDACSAYGRVWVFVAGLTNVSVHLTLFDSWTGETRAYDNNYGAPYTPVQDTGLAVCHGVRPCGQGTRVELSLTPRADPVAEELARVLEGEFTASPEAYGRVRSELASIFAAEPALADFEYFPNHRPHALSFTVDNATWSSMKAGTYQAWDCANSWYSASVEINQQYPNGRITLPGIVDLERVRSDYRRLPGMLGVGLDPQGIVVDPPPPIKALCAIARGDVYHYFFHDTGERSPEAQWTSTPGSAPRRAGAPDVALRQTCEQSYLGL